MITKETEEKKEAQMEKNQKTEEDEKTGSRRWRLFVSPKKKNPKNHRVPFKRLSVAYSVTSQNVLSNCDLTSSSNCKEISLYFEVK